MKLDDSPIITGHVCAECGNVIQTGDDPYSDHHADCPVVTNVWLVHYGNEVLCFLCDIWLLEGDTYRMIPMLPEQLTYGTVLEPGFSLRDAIRDRAVCYTCSQIKVIVNPDWQSAPANP